MGGVESDIMEYIEDARSILVLLISVIVKENGGIFTWREFQGELPTICLSSIMRLNPSN